MRNASTRAGPDPHGSAHRTDAWDGANGDGAPIEPAGRPSVRGWRRAWSGRGRQGAAAWLAYAAASVALWGLGVVPHLGSRYFSNANVGDERFYTWALAWWPHALTHGLNAFHASVVWAPQGVSMAWVTGIPGPSLLFAPLTAVAGPVAAVNVLFLLAPALAGWATYLVCRRVTGRFWPSLAGGYLFGFSTYLVDQMRGHLNLVLIFPVPLALYLVLRRLDGDLRRRTFVALLAADLLLQFSISTEVFATMVLVGGLCLLGALAFGGPAARRALLPLTRELGVAAAAALVVASPYVIATLHGRPPQAGWSTYQQYLARYSSDLAGTVVPRNFTLVGGHLAFTTSARFVTNRAEDGSYLGIPMLVVLMLAVASRWRERATRLLAAAFACVLVLSLGPVLHVLGRPSIPMPWSVLARVPALGQALPSRLSMYLWLVGAILTARWLAGGGRGSVPVPGSRSGERRARTRSALRWALVAVAAISILPVVPPPATVAVPPLFVDGRYRRYLQPNEIVLTIPFSNPDAEMLWQVEARFGFRLAGGYVGGRPIPSGERSQRAFHGLLWDRPLRVPAYALRSFLVRHAVGAVLIAPGAATGWEPLLAELGLRPIRAGGLTIYRVPTTFSHPGPDAFAGTSATNFDADPVTRRG